MLVVHYVCVSPGELITTAHQLAALTSPSTDDKDKAKSQAKHINLRKRKALADLFKYLQLLGTSLGTSLVRSDLYGI